MVDALNALRSFVAEGVLERFAGLLNGNVA
jgi:hypothetical protein